jgi:hypothetical protein
MDAIHGIYRFKSREDAGIRTSPSSKLQGSKTRAMLPLPLVF